MVEREIVSSENRQGVGDDQGRSDESGEETRAPFYRRLLRVMKRHSKQLLHVWRRRLAVARLEEFHTPPSILVVCLLAVTGAVVKRIVPVSNRVTSSPVRRQ